MEKNLKELSALVLAAGSGKRIKSNRPKVLHQILGKSIINHLLDSLVEAEIDDISVVIGPNGDLVKADVEYDVSYAYQEVQLGTGHAVLRAKEILNSEFTLIMYGDTPLIKGETVKYLIDKAMQIKADVLMMTCSVSNPSGYGRIIRKGFSFEKIVEEEDASPLERKCKEVTAGISVFRTSRLLSALQKIDNNNNNKEYYLTECINNIKKNGGSIETLKISDEVQVFGVNTRAQLAQCVAVFKDRINNYHMRNGVTIIDPNTTYIGKYVKIGVDTIIYPNTYIYGNTIIGENVEIGANCEITNCVIGDDTVIKSSTLIDSEIGKNTKVGPYAYVRPNCKIGDNVKIGDFVEVKNSTIGNGTKASHLTYLGDCDVGDNVNFGCGTVVVNYDGKNKFRSTIENNAFIGCNTNLVSPVRVGENAFTAAGSTITSDVPMDALAIARTRQIIKENWIKGRN